ncbi:MAG TPA: protease inhibitor I42 family protein [Micropepsaceae bacterium]|nr:protease inhibitor I42 family protein [Micropepsaceae bacterium]
MTKVDQSFDNRTVTISVGGTIELALKENPSTGFRWALTETGTPICELKTDGFTPTSQNPGAGGTRALTFLVRQAGETTIALRNQRRWGGAEQGGTFTLHVRATTASG